MQPEDIETFLSDEIKAIESTEDLADFIRWCEESEAEAEWLAAHEIGEKFE